MSDIGIPTIVKRLIKEFVVAFKKQGCRGPKSINSGGCGEFSDWLLEDLRKHGHYRACPVDACEVGVGLVEGLHVWTYCGGLHYDSEAPEGVEDWRDLPFFLRRKKRPRRRQSKAFEAFRLEASCDFMERGFKRLEERAAGRILP